jgi:hypothetical protein
MHRITSGTFQTNLKFIYNRNEIFHRARWDVVSIVVRVKRAAFDVFLHKGRNQHLNLVVSEGGD